MFLRLLCLCALVLCLGACEGESLDEFTSGCHLSLGKFACQPDTAPVPDDDFE